MATSQHQSRQGVPDEGPDGSHDNGEKDFGLDPLPQPLESNSRDMSSARQIMSSLLITLECKLKGVKTDNVSKSGYINDQKHKFQNLAVWGHSF